MANIYRAVEAFAFADKGGVPHSVTPGDLRSGDDPNFKGREHLFESVEVAAARKAGRAVETATAAPGESRSLSRPVKAAPKPPAKPEDKSDEAEEK